MGVVVDTSVLVHAERHRLALDTLIDRTQMQVISVVTVAELLHGVARAQPDQRARRAAFVEWVFSHLAPVSIDVTIARAYASAAGALARRGESLDANDLWIAATAMARGDAVLTLDAGFERIPGITLAPLP